MWGRLGAGLAVIWLVSLPLVTRARTPLWQSERALWQEAVERSPQKPRPWSNLGRMQHLAGDYADAERSYRHAQELAGVPGRPQRERDMGWAVATVNLALLWQHRGEVENAKGLLRTVIERYPRFTAARQIAMSWGME